jgi:hypothetical protein
MQHQKKYIEGQERDALIPLYGLFEVPGVINQLNNVMLNYGTNLKDRRNYNTKRRSVKQKIYK